MARDNSYCYSAPAGGFRGRSQGLVSGLSDTDSRRSGMNVPRLPGDISEYFPHLRSKWLDAGLEISRHTYCLYIPARGGLYRNTAWKIGTFVRIFNILTSNGTREMGQLFLNNLKPKTEDPLPTSGRPLCRVSASTITVNGRWHEGM